MRNSNSGHRGGNRGDNGSRYRQKVEQRNDNNRRSYPDRYYHDNRDSRSRRYYDEDYDDYYSRYYGYEEEEYEPEYRMYDYDDYVDEYDYGYDDIFVGEDYKYYSDMDRFQRQQASTYSGSFEDIGRGDDEYDDDSRRREAYFGNRNRDRQRR